MAQKVPAAVKMGPNETVYREFDMPEIDAESALIKVEIAGICGSDVKNYAKKIENVIMGHIIPAGSGFDLHRKARIKPLVEIIEEEPAPEAESVEPEAPAAL